MAKPAHLPNYSNKKCDIRQHVRNENKKVACCKQRSIIFSEAPAEAKDADLSCQLEAESAGTRTNWCHIAGLIWH
jgi:hypothetical protein